MKIPLLRSFSCCLAVFALGLPSAFAQTTERVSVDSLGVQGNGTSRFPAISYDGRYVAFTSYAANLVPGDANNAGDIFVHDRQTDHTTIVSVDSLGVQGNSDCDGASLSADGRYVAFESYSNNLAPGDTNGAYDVFVHDRQTGQTTRISVDSLGMQGNDRSTHPAISADGRIVAFTSQATNLVLGDTNGSEDVFVHDRQTGQTTRVSLDSLGIQGNGRSAYPFSSANGRYVGFYSVATNLVPSDTNAGVNSDGADVFIHDRQTGQTTRVSVDSAGTQGNYSSAGGSLSADGRLVAFWSQAENLALGIPDTNGNADIFIHDRQTGQTTRVSMDSFGVQGNMESQHPAISADGRTVAYFSYATNLVPNDTNNAVDVFVHDLLTGQTSRVSVDSLGMQGNGDSVYPSISVDGRHVAFYSSATNLLSGDTNGSDDVFVHDRGANGPSLVQSGTCPGLVNLTISKATASGVVAIVYGVTGIFAKPNQPCQGLTISLSSPKLLAWWTTDAAGVVSLNFSAPPRACGLSVQAVDVATCVATNVIVL